MKRQLLSWLTVSLLFGALNVNAQEPIFPSASSVRSFVTTVDVLKPGGNTIAGPVYLVLQQGAPPYNATPPGGVAPSASAFYYCVTVANVGTIPINASLAVQGTTTSQSQTVAGSTSNAMCAAPGGRPIQLQLECARPPQLERPGKCLVVWRMDLAVP